MVNLTEKYNTIIQKVGELSDEEVAVLQDITKQYPFFQTAQAIFTKYLKNNQLFYKENLEQTAARTIDRSVLFDYMEGRLFNPSKTGNKNEATRKIKNNQPEKQVQTVEKAVKKEINKPVPQTKMSYTEWLKQLNREKNQKNKDIFDAIDKFLKDKPKIVPKKDVSIPPPENIEESVLEKQMLMTETLAKLYVKQKKYNKAIQAFKILSLKYPKKSSYFANQINEVKKLK